MEVPSPDESTASIRYSDEFNDEQADIVYQSADGVRFRIHAIYLTAHSEGLAPPEGSSLSEIVHLTEPESVLELLFRFIYPNRPPVLELEVEFDRVRCLAEAAEKYQVFPVMYVCNLYMHSVLPDHAMSILGFALKHDYPNLIDDAAPHVIDEPIHNITQHIPPESYAPWPSSQWKTAIDNDIKAMTKLSRRAGHITDTEPARVEVPTGAKDNEITIESSEGEQHYIDRATLQACATGFTDPLENKIKVPEKSFTINLLLKFMKPARAPDLGSLTFEELKELTYAAEKYSVRPATAICRVFMKKALPEHAVGVFHYAARYHYLDILDLVAPLVVGTAASFDERIGQLPSEWVVAWARYYQRWQEIARKAIESAIDIDARYFGRSSDPWGNRTGTLYDSCRCGSNFLHGHLKAVISTLMIDPGALRDLVDVFSKCRCHSTLVDETVFRECREKIELLIKEIPAFSSLLL